MAEDGKQQAIFDDFVRGTLDVHPGIRQLLKRVHGPIDVRVKPGVRYRQPFPVNPLGREKSQRDGEYQDARQQEATHIAHLGKKCRAAVVGIVIFTSWIYEKIMLD